LEQLNGNSTDKLRQPRSIAYSVELVVLNKHQISGGGAYLDCYLKKFYIRYDVSGCSWIWFNNAAYWKFV